jgi:hypothetical protein
MGYELDSRGSIPDRGNIILFFKESRPAREPMKSSTQWVSGAVSPGVKCQGHEADHSSPHSAEVKNDGDIPPLPHTSSWHSA